MKITITFLFFICCIYCNAQNNYNFFHLFLDRGLSDARVNAIVQDKYGFMWFATSNGLNRFDGYSIKTFYANKRENGLTSNSILSLLSDSKGNLWAGTSNGVVKYNFSTEIFERFANGEGIDTASVSCFEEDTQGNIYAGTREGLYCFHPDTKQWENLSVFYKLKNRFTSIRGLLMFDENTLFATTENRGFYKINLAKKTLDSIYYKTEVSDTCCIFLTGMEKLNKEELLVGMLSFGMNKFNVTTNQFSTIKGPLYRSDSIKYNSVSQIIKDHQGRFWAASTYYRVAEYLPGQNLTVAIDKDPNNPYAFDGNTALCIYEDRQNNIWVGTSARGIYRFNPNQKRTQFYSENDYIKGALQQGQVTAISVLDSNTVLISSDRGPSFYHKKTNSFTNYKGVAKDFDTLAVEMASSGIEDKHGIVWIGSNRLGLMRYDTLKKTFKVFSRMSSPVPLRDDGVSDILEMNGDSLMLLGFNRIVTFDTKKFRPVCYRNNNAPLYQLKRIADFCYDNDHKNIWLASATGGIYEYDPNRKILTDKTDLLNTTVKPSVIYKLAFDSYGSMWCATDIGAIQLQKNKAAKIFTLATRKNISKEVRNVLPFGKDIWLANSRGVAKLKPGNGKLIFVGEKDGLTEVQLFGGSLTATPWNTVLIGSNRGFYEIYPDKVTEDNNDAAEPYLTNFRVFDKPFITKDIISTVKEIRLTYKENFFSFDLSAFDYAEANDIEYAYKLEGFDKDWQYAGLYRSGSYTNVPGGDYTLKLKAKNTDHHLINEEELE
ncbi:MAG: two-component regulator propeller domain-containing protein, partial [Panacibacter sp.]